MRHLCLFVCLLVLICFGSCQNSKTVENEFDPNLVKTQITKMIWEFHAADTSRNAQGVIDLLWPDFTMLADGNRTSYDNVATGSKQFMASLDHFHAEWSDIQIISLSDEWALSSFIFQDSLVSKTGTVTQNRGPTTLLWQKRDGEWRILFGDADHYPVE